MIFSIYNIAFVYQAYIFIDCSSKASKATKQHQWWNVICMMIQPIPCKQTLVYHVAVESNPYFSYTTVLFYCVDAEMTRKVCVSYRLVNSFDPHGLLHVLIVDAIIRLPLSVICEVCSSMFWIDWGNCQNTKSSSYLNLPHFQAPYSNILTHTFHYITFFPF